MNKLAEFVKGFFIGAIASVIIFAAIIAFYFMNKRNKELLEYGKKQIEIEMLREDYGNRDPREFLEIPDVRGAADGAAAEFERKRDEALQRFRSGLLNRVELAD
ncbi:MAG: hypothetical protein LBH43_19710 [Treponema sp.]|jgi:hypothetical protein|nr:hypothetical protein [Treponema sp.]